MSQTGPLCSDRNEFRVSHHLGLPEICVLYFQFQRIRYHYFSQYRIDILGNPLNFGEIMVLHPIKGRGFAPQHPLGPTAQADVFAANGALGLDRFYRPGVGP